MYVNNKTGKRNNLAKHPATNTAPPQSGLNKQPELLKVTSISPLTFKNVTSARRVSLVFTDEVERGDEQESRLGRPSWVFGAFGIAGDGGAWNRACVLRPPPRALSFVSSPQPHPRSPNKKSLSSLPQCATTSIFILACALRRAAPPPRPTRSHRSSPAPHTNLPQPGTTLIIP